MEDKYTFKQALIMAVIGFMPALIAVLQANGVVTEAKELKIKAEKVYENTAIRQSSYG